MRRKTDFFLFTNSASTTTLFASHIDSTRQPASLLVSCVVHVTVIGLVFFGIISAPNPVKITTERFSVRHLDLHMPEPRPYRSKTSPAASQAAKALQHSVTPAPAPLQQTIHAPEGPQTLLQPDLVAQAVDQLIPVPRVVIWTPRSVDVKNIIAPEPAPPATTQTKPSFDAPTPAIDVADLEIPTGAIPTSKLAVMPTSSSPVVTLDKGPSQQPPSSVTQQSGQPTPTALLSLSDLSMQDGSIALPAINETVKSSNNGALLGSSNGGAEGSGKSGNAQNGASGDAAQGALNGDALGQQATATQITLPRNGSFSAVIVGQSVTDQFPEAINAWSGRIAYTVYLHVGLSRSWILQFSIPRDDDAASAGSPGRLEAPWPFSIVRPNLNQTDINADALMIHGFVNQTGHFENLSMVFPQQFSEAPFVLKSLEQWQFRPASRNGQLARVEVLLIIPEELE